MISNPALSSPDKFKVSGYDKSDGIPKIVFGSWRGQESKYIGFQTIGRTVKQYN
jgi:hypothetical protein